MLASGLDVSFAASTSPTAIGVSMSVVGGPALIQPTLAWGHSCVGGDSGSTRDFWPFWVQLDSTSASIRTTRVSNL